MSATGKSTVGRIVANLLDYKFIDSDKEIEQRTGVDISWIFEIEGEEKFRDRESQVLDEVTRQNGIVLATGGGIIGREANRAILRSRGWVAWLKASIPELVRRAGNAESRPMLKQGDTVEESLIRLDSERRPLYESVSDTSFLTFGSDKRVLARAIADWYLKVTT